MYQTDPPRPAKEVLPTMYDLPSEDPEELGLPDEFHIFQPRLLGDTFATPNYPPDQVFVASDHTLWYKRPDWFSCCGSFASLSELTHSDPPTPLERGLYTFPPF